MMAATALLAACTEAELVDGGISTQEGDMPVKLSFIAPTPDDGVATRSTISGAETPFTKVKMVCFASTGYFLGIREADATAWDSNHEGTLTGAVPAATTSVHFVAGIGDVDASALIGQQEATVMHSATSPFVSTVTDGMRYWGHYKAATANEMGVWLKNSSSKLYFVRDRAQITVVRDGSLNPDITDIAWTVVNGLEKGYIAPYSSMGEPFVVTGDVADPDVKTTPFTSASRFNDITSWTELGQSQFIFDDRNEAGTGRTPLVILMRAKFNGGAYKYFKAMLEDNHYRQIRVTRNHRYTVTLMDLEERICYDNVADALAGTPVNGFLKSIDERVPSINYKQQRLVINEEQGTTLMFSSGTDAVIHFQLLNPDGSAVSTATATDFFGEWLEDENETAPYRDTDVDMTYDATSGDGTMTIHLATIDATLKKGRLMLSYKEGHIRYLTIYTHSEYTIEDVGTFLTKTGGTFNSKNVFKASFKIPDDYPDALFPVKVRVATSTLRPFDDVNGTTDNYKKFSVIVGNTDNLTNSTIATDWNYNASTWGFWYEYPIETRPTDGEVTLYFQDVSANLKTVPSTVGLFVDIDNCGIKSGSIAK